MEKLQTGLRRRTTSWKWSNGGRRTTLLSRKPSGSSREPELPLQHPDLANRSSRSQTVLLLMRNDCMTERSPLSNQPTMPETTKPMTILFKIPCCLIQAQPATSPTTSIALLRSGHQPLETLSMPAILRCGSEAMGACIFCSEDHRETTP